MKKILSILFMCGIVAAASVDWQYVYVNSSISGIWPVVAEPGEDVRLQIMGSNIGRSEALNVSIVANSDVLTLKKPCEINADRILPGNWIGKDCEFIVNPDSVSGDYKVYLTTKYYNNQNVPAEISTGVDISIRGTPRYVVEKIWTTPSGVAPGDTFKLYVNVKNTGSGDARNLYFDLIGTGIVVMPARVYLAKLARNETKTIEFNVDANKNASASVISVVMGINYQNEKMENKVSTETIALDLSGRSKLKIKSMNFSPADYGAGDRVDISIFVENEGNDAENSEVCINSNIFSKQCYYLGKITSKTYSGAGFTFSMPISVVAGNKYPMTVELKSDDFSETKVINLVPRDKKADLRVSRIKSSPEILYINSRATFEIRIENYGHGEARDARIKIKLNGNEYESIVGRIYSNDRATANFYIPKINTAGVIDIPVEISYEDSSGRQTIQDSAQITVLGSEGGNELVIAILILIMVILAYAFRKKILAMVKKG